LVTAAAADLGAADTTPDNLYMIGTFRLEPDQALVLDKSCRHSASGSAPPGIPETRRRAV
jgi:hypothetical protein